MKVKRLCAVALSFVLTAAMPTLYAGQGGFNNVRADEYSEDDVVSYDEGYSYDVDLYSASWKNVERRTKTEIRNFYKNHPFDLKRAPEYSDMPGLSPYKAGAVSDRDRQEALNSLNFMRYIAGIDADVELKAEYNELTQHASVLMKKNNVLTHYPEKPSDMPDDFYNKGKKAAGSSNIGWNYRNLAQSIVWGYMDDDGSNIDRVGHRRWCLNPSMKYTGFGLYDTYSAMYVFDNTRANAAYTYVPWPARLMPKQYFSGPWTISLNRGYYSAYNAEIKVKLTSPTGQVYNFGPSGSDGYYNFEVQGYGMGPCIIFKPDVKLENSGVYTVHVSGLTDKDGVNKEISYTVEFFDIDGSDTDDNGSNAGSGDTDAGNSNGNDNGSGTGNNNGNDNGSGTGNNNGNDNGSGAGNNNGSGTGNNNGNNNGSSTGNNNAGTGTGDNNAGADTGNTGNNNAGNGNVNTGNTGRGSGGGGGRGSGGGSGRGSGGSSGRGSGRGNSGGASGFGNAGNRGDYDSEDIKISSPTYTYGSWEYSGSKWRLNLLNGSYAKNAWAYFNGSWYVFGNDGTMKTGWVKVNGEWHYMSSSGNMLSGWVKTGTTWYYLDNNGYLVKNRWINYSGRWYYITSGGYMLVNGVTPDGYRVGSDGVYRQ